ncbi:MAG: hypothetical protein AAFP17_11635 [Pseudomonadota bacterium]
MLLAWPLLLFPVGAVYTQLPPSPDQALFAHYGALMGSGFVLYTDLFDHAWPGPFVLNYLAVALFGVESWSTRLFDLLVLQIVLGGGLLFLRRAGYPLAAAAFPAFYLVFYANTGYWNAGQGDFVGAGFLVVAMALLLGRGTSWARLASLFAAGLFIGAAVALRPTLALFACGVLLLEALPGWTGANGGSALRPTRLIAVSCGVLAVLAALVGAAVWVGNLSDFHQQAIALNIGDDRVGAVSPALFFQLWYWHWLFRDLLLIFAAVGFCAWIALPCVSGGEADSRSVRYAVLLTLGLFATGIASFAVQNKGYEYHILPTFPALVLGGLAGAEALMRRIVSSVGAAESREPLPGAGAWLRRWVGGLLLLSLLAVSVLSAAGAILPPAARTAAAALRSSDGERWRIAIPGQTLSNASLDEALAAMAVAGNAPEGELFFIGTDFELAFLANRAPATRYVAVPAFFSLARRNALGAQWMEEYVAALEKRPAVIYTDDRVLSSAGGPEHPLRLSLRRLTAEHYREAFSEGSRRVFVLRR